MLQGKKIVVVLPAYNASKTLARTYREIDLSIVDEVVLVDDFSLDETESLSKSLGIRHTIRHTENRGYGANQKTCYNAALALEADVIIMLHPDYQYTPKLIPAMASIIAAGLYPVVIGSRILGGGALRGGMPRYKYVANRLLTLFQNILLGQKLSEYHSGYRAYSREVLEAIPYRLNSDDFIFDNQILSQIIFHGFQIAEITCPTKYFSEASSITLLPSIKYGFGIIRVTATHLLHRLGFLNRARYRRTPKPRPFKPGRV